MTITLPWLFFLLVSVSMVIMYTSFCVCIDKEDRLRFVPHSIKSGCQKIKTFEMDLRYHDHVGYLLSLSSIYTQCCWLNCVSILSGRFWDRRWAINTFVSFFLVSKRRISNQSGNLFRIVHSRRRLCWSNCVRGSWHNGRSAWNCRMEVCTEGRFRYVEQLLILEVDGCL